MSAHERRISELGPSGRKPRFDLARVDLQRIAKKFVVFTPSAGEIAALAAAAGREIGGGADPALVCRVVQRNPDSFWGIAHRDESDEGRRVAVGFLAFLMLNEEGMRRLIDRSLDTVRPPLELTVRQNEKPAGIYVWAAYATGLAAGGVPLAFEKTTTRLYADVDLYARAVTAGGRDMLEALGFQRGAVFKGRFSTQLYSYRRSSLNTDSRPARGPRAEKDDISITVVHTMEELLRVFAIRSATYIAEQDCPYVEEFEGNDFSGSHLLAYVGDEPAGCLRIRYFADFAKLERLAVLRRFRSRGLGAHLMRAGLELCRVKGYRKIYGHAQKRLAKYYADIGFRVLESARPVRFSGFDYVEILYEAAKHPHALALGTDPYTLLRLEGQWHEAGPLDPPMDGLTSADRERAA